MIFDEQSSDQAKGYFFSLLTGNPYDISYMYVDSVPMSRWL